MNEQVWLESVYHKFCQLCERGLRMSALQILPKTPGVREIRAKKGGKKRMLGHTFKGGIHPYDGKELSKDKAISSVIAKSKNFFIIHPPLRCCFLTTLLIIL